VLPGCAVGLVADVCVLLLGADGGGAGARCLLGMLLGGPSLARALLGRHVHHDDGDVIRAALGLGHAHQRVRCHPVCSRRHMHSAGLDVAICSCTSAAGASAMGLQSSM
jgi:hypothetical protein